MVNISVICYVLDNEKARYGGYNYLEEVYHYVVENEGLIHRIVSVRRVVVVHLNTDVLERDIPVRAAEAKITPAALNSWSAYLLFRI